MSEHYYTGAPTSRHDIRRLSICVEGRTLDFDTDAGVFSRGELDAGTELMIRSLPPLAGRVLDLGGAQVIARGGGFKVIEARA